MILIYLGVCCVSEYPSFIMKRNGMFIKFNRYIDDELQK